MFRLLLLLSLLTSCATSKHQGKWKNADERLWPYISLFEEEYGKKLPKDLYFKFARLKKSDGTAARSSAICSVNTKKMYMNEDQWYRFDERTIENIVFHEIGHCYLMLKHSSYGNLNKNECPSSIMNWQGAAINQCYQRHRKYYVEELFFRAKYSKSKYRRRR